MHIYIYISRGISLTFSLPHWMRSMVLMAMGLFPDTCIGVIAIYLIVEINYYLWLRYGMISTYHISICIVCVIDHPLPSKAKSLAKSFFDQTWPSLVSETSEWIPSPTPDDFNKNYKFMPTQPWPFRNIRPIQFNSIHNIFIVSQHTSYMIHNVSTQITFYWHIHIYILQWQAYIMGAKGAGNPIGFMGPLSDTLNLIYLNKGAGGARVQQW